MGLGFSFDPVKHIYTLDGEKLPGITTMLSDCGFTDAKWAKDEHRDRGTAVHELSTEIAYLERPESAYEWDGTCGCGAGEACRHQNTLGYGHSFLKGIRSLKFVVEPGMSELGVYTRLYRCAGTLDFWGFTHGTRKTLIDVKSGKPQYGVAIQLAGYRVMLRESHGVETDVSYALWLDKDGKMPKVIQPERPAEDERIFKSLVEVWHWRKAHGLLPWKGTNSGA